MQGYLVTTLATLYSSSGMLSTAVSALSHSGDELIYVLLSMQMYGSLFERSDT